MTTETAASLQHLVSPTKHQGNEKEPSRFEDFNISDAAAQMQQNVLSGFLISQSFHIPLQIILLSGRLY